MALTRIRTDNILDREVNTNDLADGAVTFDKINLVDPGAAGDVLTVDAFGNLLFAPASATPRNLASLTDVDPVGAIFGSVLVYNGVDTWVPSNAYQSPFFLNSLQDTTVSLPLNNQYLGYNGSQWVNKRISIVELTNVAPVAITNYFGDLTGIDVDGTKTSAPAATIGQVLKFVGDRWVAGSPTDIGVIDQLDDVDTTTTPPATNDALVWNGTMWVPANIGGAVFSSNTFMVDDITERNTLSPALGDQAFVRTGTSGEWEIYLWDGIWILTATNDSAASDANTIEAIVNFNTGSPVLLGNISAESRVTLVSVEVITVFDGTPTLTIGDAGDNARLIDDDLHDLTVLGTYNATTDYIYSNAIDTDIFAYFSFPGATQGQARVLVTYV